MGSTRARRLQAEATGNINNIEKKDRVPLYLLLLYPPVFHQHVARIAHTAHTATRVLLQWVHGLHHVQALLALPTA